MSEKEKQQPELTAFEAELASLRPNAGGLENGRLDVGRLMFEAGRAAALKERRRRATFIWPAAFAAMSGAAAVMLLMLVNRPEPRVVERIVRVEVPAKSTFVEEQPGERLIAEKPDSPLKKGATAADRSEFGFLASLLSGEKRHAGGTVDYSSPAFYRELRERILVDGLDALADSTSGNGSHGGGERISRDELLKELLGKNNKS